MCPTSYWTSIEVYSVVNGDMKLIKRGEDQSFTWYFAGACGSKWARHFVMGGHYFSKFKTAAAKYDTVHNKWTIAKRKTLSTCWVYPQWAILCSNRTHFDFKSDNAK